VSAVAYRYLLEEFQKLFSSLFLQICAPGWKNAFSPNYYLMNGICYWTDNTTDVTASMETVTPLVNLSKYKTPQNKAQIKIKLRLCLFIIPRRLLQGAETKIHTHCFLLHTPLALPIGQEHPVSCKSKAN
jgi:hypothetical protein